MIDFVKYADVDRIALYERSKDCELNLLAFNCVTPMASCIEIVLKSLYRKYDSSLYDNEINRLNLSDILKDRAFTEWLSVNFGITDKILSVINNPIRTENNNFKHSYRHNQPINSNIKHEMFKTFYQFVALYYEGQTKMKAPPWSEDAYYKLVKRNLQIKNMKQEYLLNCPISGGQEQ